MKKSLKFISFWLLFLYVASLFIKIPDISDSFIVLGLCSLYGFELWLDRQREKDPKENIELKELKESLEIEGLKLSIENIKLQQVKQSQMRAAQSELGESGDKKFIF